MSDQSSEYWQRISDAFDRAVASDGTQARAAFLAQLRSSDPTLCRDVESLLAAHEISGPADVLLEELEQELDAAVHVERIGERIGPYRITAILGHGGMGAVYLAEREGADFEQQVAIKLLRVDRDGSDLRRRFVLERQIVARLAHPAIARLLDGGIGARGEPYLVMEYVAGNPIDVYCDGQQLDVEHRLALFLDVCDAVQYAHQHLVVHRDLKPSNILVDADGTVKLLDFGLAKLLEPETRVATESTRAAAHWFTPQYASPEQIRQDPVTTATDIYSLGVVLYELLSGRSPYAGTPSSARELLRAVCEHEPEPVSDAVHRRPAAAAHDRHSPPESIGAARKTAPERLRRRLAGDLDTIVARALSKEPERRYESIGELADDIRRHLGGLPVRARPDTFAYRLSKFARRNKIGVAASVFIAFSLVGGGVATAWQASVARRERDNAQREAHAAARVSSLLVDLFKLSDPIAQRGATITAREVLAEGARRIEHDLAGDRELQARMMYEVGQVYMNLALFPQADSFFTRALALERGAHRGAHAEMATALHAVATVKRRLGAYAEAESLFRSAVDMRRKLFGETHENVAESLFGLATALHDVGKFNDAEPYFRETLSIYRSLPGDRVYPLAATTLITLGTVLTFKGRADEAEPLLREALQFRRSLFGDEHAHVVEALTALGSMLHYAGRSREAEPLLSEALRAGPRVLGPQHPTVSETKLVFAATLSNEGRYAESERVIREVYQTYLTSQEISKPEMVNTLLLLGRAQLAQGKVDSAATNFALARTTAVASLGTTHPFVAASDRWLAAVDHERGRFADAERGLRAALAALEARMRPNHPQILDARRALASVLRDRGAMTAAESLYTAVLAVERATRSKFGIEMSNTLIGLGALYLARKEPDRAEPLLREALDIRQIALTSDHWLVGEAQSELGESLRLLNRIPEASTHLREAHAKLQAARGNEDRRTRVAATRLVRGQS